MATGGQFSGQSVFWLTNFSHRSTFEQSTFFFRGGQFSWWLVFWVASFPEWPVFYKSVFKSEQNFHQNVYSTNITPYEFFFKSLISGFEVY